VTVNVIHPGTTVTEDFDRRTADTAAAQGVKVAAVLDASRKRTFITPFVNAKELAGVVLFGLRRSPGHQR
jgi:NAD(P)-dependent dehydrogenase (short-subunit alcohol dehydrogenase family)